MTKSARRTFLKYSALAASGFASRSVFTSIADGANAFSQTASGTQFFAQANNCPEVIAHRGGDGQWPGETMYAMRHAKEIGVDVLEMDVYLTKDDQLVLMHDNSPASTTELGLTKGLKPVSDFTLAELQRLNAGYEWGKKHNETKFFQPEDKDKQDLRVPTLREVFTAFPHLRMNIEMKKASRSPVAALGRLIADCGMADNVLVASLVDSFIVDFRSQNKNVATSASLRESIAYLFQNKHPNAQAIQIGPEILTRLGVLTHKRVDRAHSDGLQVHTWTTNNLENMMKMKSIEVDGIITDFPGPLLGLLNRTKPA